MKYYLLFMLPIVSTINAVKVKRIGQPRKDYYKTALHNALIECKNICRETKDSEYIAKYGATIMQKIARHIGAKQEYTAAFFCDDYASFLEFYTQLKRKIKPEVYQGLLDESLDQVNDAFNDMKKRKANDKIRRLAQKKVSKYSDSFSDANREEIKESDE